LGTMGFGYLVKKEVYKLVGLIYGLVGVIVFFFNIVFYLINTGSLKDFDLFALIYIIIGIVLILLSITRKEYLRVTLGKKRLEISIKRLSCLIQFYIMFLICVYSIMDAHDSQYNLAMVLIAGMMGLKYQILKRNTLIAFIVIIAVLFEVSAAIAGVHMRGLYIILFSVFFFGITIIMYQEDLKRHFELAKSYHEKLITLERIFEKFKGETIDVSSIMLTPRELEVLKELCLSRATNQEIADTMGLKIQTIKTHIRNIFDKSGVDDRYQLIDLFRNNFIEES